MFRSKISVELDYANNNEIILQILHPLDATDDVRDSMLRTFLQSLTTSSSWLTVKHEDKHRPDEMRITIRAVTPDRLHQEATIMMEQVRVNKLFNMEKIGHNIRDNSNGFRDLLDAEGIKWTPNGHGTFIFGDVDLFELGRKVENAKLEYKQMVESK